MVFPLWTEALTVNQSPEPGLSPEGARGDRQAALGALVCLLLPGIPGQVGPAQPRQPARPGPAPGGDLVTAGSSLVSGSHPSLGLLNLTCYQPERREGFHWVTKCHLESAILMASLRTHSPRPPKATPSVGVPSEHPQLCAGLKVQTCATLALS